LAHGKPDRPCRIAFEVANCIAVPRTDRDD
jgi:hypothetical protein